VNPERAARVSKSFVAGVAIAFFLLALAGVFVGFVGYVSRVNLTSEFQKDGNENIDHIFMSINRLKQDEKELSRLRRELQDKNLSYRRQINVIGAESDVSDQYRKYFDFILDFWSIVQRYASILQPEYLERANAIDYVHPSLQQSSLFASPLFKPDSSKEEQDKLLALLNQRLPDFRTAIVEHIARFYYRQAALRDEQAGVSYEYTEQIRAIVTRQPQLAVADEQKDWKLAAVDPAKLLQLEKQRAVLQSYENAMYGLAWVLEWPIIVLTMFVTLAMGLLGGVVSFMRISIDAPHQLVLSELLRRSFLGIAAALGIFLLAGSGLLVLTAQSSKAFTPSTIELSPYFVAFLAFISGFMADDAFARLTKAGRSIFQGEEEREKAAKEKAEKEKAERAEREKAAKQPSAAPTA
jgi:hypothetical protein